MMLTAHFHDSGYGYKKWKWPKVAEDSRASRKSSRKCSGRNLRILEFSCSSRSLAYGEYLHSDAQPFLTAEFLLPESHELTNMNYHVALGLAASWPDLRLRAEMDEMWTAIFFRIFNWICDETKNSISCIWKNVDMFFSYHTSYFFSNFFLPNRMSLSHSTKTLLWLLKDKYLSVYDVYRY